MVKSIDGIDWNDVTVMSTVSGYPNWGASFKKHSVYTCCTRAHTVYTHYFFAPKGGSLLAIARPRRRRLCRA
jgi:hypothetical protein